MVSVNLETNPIFKEKLAQQGFRKKGVNFVREYNESIQTFGFGYDKKDGTNGNLY